MNIEKIRLINFRNYPNLYLEVNKNINLFLGKNGQGKTNFIEAIYLAALGRSFRTNRDLEMINFDKNQAYIGVLARINQLGRTIEIKLDRERPKRIKINNNEIDNLKELYSGLNVVSFSPQDLSLIKDGPSVRRSFLDLEIGQIRPIYSYNIGQYQKVLYQRNNMIRRNLYRKDFKSLLDIFNIQLARLGTRIVLDRYKFINRLGLIVKEKHKEITKDQRELILDYKSNIPILDDLEEMEKNYIYILNENLEKDLEARTTTIGPHRDDFISILDGKDLRTYGSQGQVRSLVLAIKLAELDLIKELRGEYPVLLLDDVFSELDYERRRELIKSIENVQTFITSVEDIDKDLFKNIEYDKFKVEKLRIEKINKWR